MAAIVEGVYKQGKIELLQEPPGIPEGRVRVIVLPEPERAKPLPRLITFGMYRGDRMSTLEDFKEVQWHGENEWDDEDG